MFILFLIDVDIHVYILRKASKKRDEKEEDITKIIWAKKEELGKYFKNTFPTIVEVLKHA